MIMGRKPRQENPLEKMIGDHIEEHNSWSPETTEEKTERAGALDGAITDPDPWVRAEVAKKGYCLFILIKDKSPYVRAEVAKQRYCLHKLVNDKEPYVRATVARTGNYLGRLAYDEDEGVRAVAIDKLISIVTAINEIFK